MLHQSEILALLAGHGFVSEGGPDNYAAETYAYLRRDDSDEGPDMRCRYVSGDDVHFGYQRTFCAWSNSRDFFADCPVDVRGWKRLFERLDLAAEKYPPSWTALGVDLDQFTTPRRRKKTKRQRRTPQ